MHGCWKSNLENCPVNWRCRNCVTLCPAWKPSSCLRSMLKVNCDRRKRCAIVIMVCHGTNAPIRKKRISTVVPHPKISNTAWPGSPSMSSICIWSKAEQRCTHGYESTVKVSIGISNNKFTFFPSDFSSASRNMQFAWPKSKIRRHWTHFDDSHSPLCVDEWPF